MADTKKYWFPAKRYGWGWGIPTTWQGWVVLAVFFSLLAVGAPVVLPRFGPVIFVFYTGGLTGILIAVCWIKGERPRWRWGDKDDF